MFPIYINMPKACHAFASALCFYNTEAGCQETLDNILSHAHHLFSTVGNNTHHHCTWRSPLFITSRKTLVGRLFILYFIFKTIKPQRGGLKTMESSLELLLKPNTKAIHHFLRKGVSLLFILCISVLLQLPHVPTAAIISSLKKKCI